MYILVRVCTYIYTHMHTYLHFEQDCTRYGKKNCSNNFTWSHVLPASNSSGYEIYNGSSCKPFLQTWQECAIGQNEDVFVNVSGDQKILENEVSAVLALIGENIVIKMDSISIIYYAAYHSLSLLP